MAEYYPLISRAVAGLRAGTPETRKAIYDRARQALVGQLRSMDPPVPEDAIARETAALDDAIARTEAEMLATAEPAAAAPEPRSAPAGPQTPPRVGAEPATKGAGRKGPTEAPSLGGAKRDMDPSADTSSRAKAPASAPLVRPTPPRSPLRPASGLPAPASTPTSEPAATATPTEAEPAQEAGPAMPVAAALRVEPIAAAGTELAHEADGAEPSGGEGEPAALRERPKDEAARPAAPRPAEERRSNLRLGIVAVVALAALVVIAVTAWRLRDNPAELTRAPTPATAQTTPEKVAERASDADSGSSTATPPVASDETTRATTDAAPTPGTPVAAAQPTAGAPTAPASPTAPPAPQTQNEASLPIAYKAAILIEAPDTPEKVKTYVGTVVWHAQSVPTGQGQPLGLAIQADVSIPEADLQLMMQIRRNTESQLPASHTVDLKFTIGPNSPVGSIKQVSVPQMRQQDQPTGDGLTGIPVTIADNYFLVGLVRGAPEDHNLDLLRSRQWIDIPLLLSNGKASKITFEKGANGDHIFGEVLDSWKNAPN